MRTEVQTIVNSFRNESVSQETGLSFDEVFTLHHRAVFATARGVVRDATLAEEITQEVFLKLYRHFESKPNGELLRPWLLRVTLNEARNTLRGQNRSRAREATYQKNTDPTMPQVDYERRQEVETARRALDKIKEPMRTCLLLRHQGLSYREIAQTLSLKETYVGSLVARGRKEFVRYYAGIGVK
ncbi:MAG TPA: sigma-70 family RNA polymerase sigma factor [Pyrinomonadaceae bacterium]|nr:sigma-70 family RNA polymerase sigma factor [Pyrinomonadaceae bacterium]